MEEVGATANQQFVFMAWALDFVRSMQKDVQTMIPDRNKETFYEFETFGYHEVRLPGDYYDYISVGTQIGHYV